jgi:hypothetical protein
MVNVVCGVIKVARSPIARNELSWRQSSFGVFVLLVPCAKRYDWQNHDRVVVCHVIAG